MGEKSFFIAWNFLFNTGALPNNDTGEESTHDGKYFQEKTENSGDVYAQAYGDVPVWKDITLLLVNVDLHSHIIKLELQPNCCRGGG